MSDLPVPPDTREAMGDALCRSESTGAFAVAVELSGADAFCIGHDLGYQAALAASRDREGRLLIALRQVSDAASDLLSVDLPSLHARAALNIAVRDARAALSDPAEEERDA